MKLVFQSKEWRYMSKGEEGEEAKCTIQSLLLTLQYPLRV